MPTASGQWQVRIALMLFCFIVVRSLISSSLETTRPDTELNSWRLTPLKTMRFPFSIMMWSFISKRRNPTLCGISSCTVPSSAVTSSRRSYSTGVSADHSSGWSTFRTNCVSPSSTPSVLCSAVLSFDRIIFTFPFPIVFVSMTRSAFVNVSSSSVCTFRSETWTSGIVYRYTSR